jgi:hypothetical protein
MVWYEARIAKERINALLSSEITLMHTAMVTVMSSKPREAVKNLTKQLKDLRNGY